MPKVRKDSLDKEARRLAGISGIKVYEVRNHPNPRNWYYGIVWREREICTVAFPWDANKFKLEIVGRTFRYGLAQEEQDEINNSEQRLIDDDNKVNADVEKQMEKDAMWGVRKEKGLAPEYIY